MSAILVYTEDFCPYCLKAKSLLDIKGLKYEEIKVKTDKDRENLANLSHRKTLPQIFINNYHVGGCDDLYELNDNGELDELIDD